MALQIHSPHHAAVTPARSHETGVTSTGPTPSVVGGVPTLAGAAPGTDEHTLQLMLWLARGYTIRRIQMLALRNGWHEAPTPQEIISARVELDSTLVAIRDTEADFTMKYGVAKKEERIRRLTEVVEVLEDYLPAPIGHAVPDPDGEGPGRQVLPNLKLIKEYRALLKDISEETQPRPGPSGLGGEGDKWVLLLERLQTPQMSSSLITAPAQSSKAASETIVEVESPAETSS